MCEILGINSNKPFTANEVLWRFYDESKDHPDGWGLAVFSNNGVSLEKEALQATKSRYLFQRLSGDITCENLLAHIRRASVGSIEYVNCHPFVRDDISGKTWTFMHNGTFFDSDMIIPYSPQQEGTTDSEAMLLYILDRVNIETKKKNGFAPEDELPEDKRLNPLTFEEWQPVPMMQLQAYKRGERIMSGTIHGKEFFEEEHDMGMVYMTYASL